MIVIMFLVENDGLSAYERRQRTDSAGVSIAENDSHSRVNVGNVLTGIEHGGLPPRDGDSAAPTWHARSGLRPTGRHSALRIKTQNSRR